MLNTRMDKQVVKMLLINSAKRYHYSSSSSVLNNIFFSGCKTPYYFLSYNVAKSCKTDKKEYCKFMFSLTNISVNNFFFDLCAVDLDRIFKNKHIVITEP